LTDVRAQIIAVIFARVVATIGQPTLFGLWRASDNNILVALLEVFLVIVRNLLVPLPIRKLMLLVICLCSIQSSCNLTSGA
jgi:hypothetical protein